MNLFIDSIFVPTLKPNDHNTLVAVELFSEAVTDLALSDDNVLDWLNEEHNLEAHELDEECEIARLVDDVLYVSIGQLPAIFTEEYGNEYEGVLQRIISQLDNTTESVLNLTGRGVLVVPEKTEEQLNLPESQGPISVAELGKIFANSPLAAAFEESPSPLDSVTGTSSLMIDGRPVGVIHRGLYPRVFNIRELMGAVYGVAYDLDYIRQVLVSNRMAFNSLEVVKNGGEFYATSAALGKTLHGLTPIAENKPLCLEILAQYEADPAAFCSVDFFGNPV